MILEIIFRLFSEESTWFFSSSIAKRRFQSPIRREIQILLFFICYFSIFSVRVLANSLENLYQHQRYLKELRKRNEIQKRDLFKVKFTFFRA